MHTGACPQRDCRRGNDHAGKGCGGADTHGPIDYPEDVGGLRTIGQRDVVACPEGQRPLNADDEHGIRIPLTVEDQGLARRHVHGGWGVIHTWRERESVERRADGGR